MNVAKKAIARALFRNVFFFYILISIAVISALSVKQYMDSRDQIIRILKIHEVKYVDKLADALWNMDMHALESLISRLHETSEIVGIKVTDHHAQKTFMVRGDVTGNVSGQPFFSTLYEHEFPIDIRHDTGTERVGFAAIYTSPTVIYEIIKFRIYLMIAALFIMMAALWIILNYVSRRVLSQPLARLTRLTETLQFTNLDMFQPSSIQKGGDELDTLEDAFMSMTQRLKEAKQEIAKSHDQLEQRVEKRTAELMQEIAERKQAESQILTLSQAIEQSPVSVLVTDIDGNIEYTNKSFERVYGFNFKEVLGQNLCMLSSSDIAKAHYQDLWETINQGKIWQGEFENIRKNGEVFWENVHFSPVLDKTGNTLNYVGVQEDVTLRKQQDERILQQAYYDNLTGLPNRFLIIDRLSQLIIEADRFDAQVAVIFLDLDDFKKVNDTLGHDSGDILLQLVATRLSDAVREGDTIGRLGGDEFVILLGGLKDTEDAFPIVDKLLNCFKAPFKVENRDLIMTASIGVSVYPENGDNPAQLLRNADVAMYHSKKQGRNTIHYFTEAMNSGVSRRLMLEQKLYSALANNELFLSYQPLVDISSRTVIGAEALLRWNNPELGSISPDEFIPLAEQTGLIVPIGEYVLTQAISRAAEWSEKSATFKIAVNLSPRQFRQLNLVSFIEQALLHNGVKGQNLELEITEGVLMGHGHIDDALIALRKLGIGIAMDDFGTGYSSLSYLRSYPFDTLKIDRSFINDIAVDPADRELVNAAIAMAHGLGMKVVAEGVETEIQLAHLSTQQCDFAQGYLFSRPVAPEVITRMLEEQTSKAKEDINLAIS